MDERNETQVNAKLKKLKRQRTIFLTLAVILNIVLLLVVVWNLFSSSLYVDLNTWGPFILLVMIINYIYYYISSSWYSLRLKNQR